MKIISDDSGDITSVKVRLYRALPGGSDSVLPGYFNKLVNLKDEYDGVVFSYLMNGASSTHLMNSIILELTLLKGSWKRNCLLVRHQVPISITWIESSFLT